MITIICIFLPHIRVLDVIIFKSVGYTLTLLADYTPEELAHFAMVVFNPL
ncbi:hypothetical protein [Symbiopectobacterium sp. RP]